MNHCRFENADHRCKVVLDMNSTGAFEYPTFPLASVFVVKHDIKLDNHVACWSVGIARKHFEVSLGLELQRKNENRHFFST